jgi:uncharacterized protein YecT (DUF1311 family)
MFGKGICQIDARLTQGLDDAILRADESRRHQNLIQEQANEILESAQAAWIEHKMSCTLCCGQLAGKFSSAHQVNSAVSVPSTVR